MKLVWGRILLASAAGTGRAGENRVNSLLECGSWLRTDEVTNDPAAAIVKDGFGHRAGPRGIHTTIEGVHVDSRLLTVVRKRGLIFVQETTNQVRISVVIKTDSEHSQSLRRVLLRKLDDHREFIAAWLAPRSPKRDQQRLPSIFGQYLVVPGEIDQGKVTRGRALVRRRRTLRRRCLGVCSQTNSQQQRGYGRRQLHDLWGISHGRRPHVRILSILGRNSHAGREISAAAKKRNSGRYGEALRRGTGRGGFSRRRDGG